MRENDRDIEMEFDVDSDQGPEIEVTSASSTKLSSLMTPEELLSTIFTTALSVHTDNLKKSKNTMKYEGEFIFLLSDNICKDSEVGSEN